MQKFEAGDKVEVVGCSDKDLRNFNCNSRIVVGYKGTVIRNHGSKDHVLLDDLDKGWIHCDWIKKIKSNKQEETKMSNKTIEVGDTVEVIASGGGLFHSDNKGKQGVVTKVSGQDSDDRLYVSFDEESDYGHIEDVKLITKQKGGQKVKHYNPAGGGNVVRIEVLYNDNTRYNVASLTNFEYDVRDSNGVYCFKYTKPINEDVDCDFYIKKENVAAIIMRSDNGKTEIHEFVEKVVDTVQIRMQNRPAKTVLTPEQAAERAERRGEKAAKRLDPTKVPKAKAKAKTSK
jgi:hypothetical protein